MNHVRLQRGKTRINAMWRRGARSKLAVVAIAVVLAGQGAGAISVHARVQFNGDEFQVNSYTTRAQYDPSVAADPNGNFVIVWASRFQDPFGSTDVYGQRYDGSGAQLGTEFRVNTYTTERQYAPVVAAAENDGFVVAWASWAQDGSEGGIFGQRFDSGGDPAGVEFQVNMDLPPAHQWRPAVASGIAGNFLVVWQHFTPTGGTDLFARAYDNVGVPVGEEFQVNTYTTKSQTVPRACADDSGDFVVVWQSGSIADSPTDQDGSGPGVFGRQFDAFGLPRGGEFLVPSYTTYNQDHPDVACAPNGEFVVVWSGYGPSGKMGGEVFARHFSAEAVPTGPQLQLRTFPTANLPPNDLLYPIRRPQVAYGEDGAFLVVWTDRLHESVGTGNSDIVGQFLTADVGQPRGTNFVLTTFPNALNLHSAVGGSSDGFVVAWTSGYADYYTQDGSQEGVFARRVRRVPECGDATDDGHVAATDALIALAASTGSETCELCVCDVDGSGTTTASDALLILWAGVGLAPDLECVSC